MSRRIRTFEAHVLPVVAALPRNSLFLHAHVAMLHDVLEDGPFSADDLIALGVDKRVIKHVLTLTRGKTETYAQYIERVSRDDVARVVKVADLKVNLRNNPADSLRARYESALKTLGAQLTP